MSIQCEQALIGWGPRSSGKNVLAVSPGWPEDDYPRARLLADTGRFLQEGREVANGPHGQLARAVEWLPRPGGPLLLGKAYLPNTARSGTFYVHVLLDAARKLSPAALGPLTRAGKLATAAVAPDDAAVGTLTLRPADLVPVSTGPGPAPDGFVLVAALVGAIRRGRALVIRAENLDDALALVEQAAGLVPPGIGRLLHWSTLVPDAGAPPGPGLAVAVPPWSANTEAATPVDRLTAGESDRLIARQLLAPSQALPGFRTLDEVLDWFTIVGTDVAALTQEQFDRALATPWAASIVDSCPVTRAGWQLLLNAMTNGTLDEQRWGALGRVPPGTGDALLEPGYLRLQDALAATLPDDLLRALVEQPTQPRHVVSTALADRLAALGYNPTDFVCRAGTSRWSPWTDEVLKRHQQGLEVSSDHLQILCAKPATAARLARWLVSHKVFAADDGRDFLGRLPAGTVAPLLKAMVEVEKVPAAGVLTLAERLPQAQLLEFLTEHWPALALRLGIPASIAELLVVRQREPGGFWSGLRSRRG